MINNKNKAHFTKLYDNYQAHCNAWDQCYILITKMLSDVLVQPNQQQELSFNTQACAQFASQLGAVVFGSLGLDFFSAQINYDHKTCMRILHKQFNVYNIQQYQQRLVQILDFSEAAEIAKLPLVDDVAKYISICEQYQAKLHVKDQIQLMLILHLNIYLNPSFYYAHQIVAAVVLVILGVQLMFLSEQEGFEILQKLASLACEHFSSWTDFLSSFLLSQCFLYVQANAPQAIIARIEKWTQIIAKVIAHLHLNEYDSWIKKIHA